MAWANFRVATLRDLSRFGGGLVASLSLYNARRIGEL